MGHFFRDCPHRFVKGKPMKGLSKGSAQWNEHTYHMYFIQSRDQGDVLEPAVDNSLEGTTPTISLHAIQDTLEEQNIGNALIPTQEPILHSLTTVEGLSFAAQNQIRTM